MIVLVDTNILLDSLQHREAFAAAADAAWKQVEVGSLIGYVSGLSFNNIFYIARKKDGVEKALQALRLVRGIFRVVALDEFIIDRALASSGRDFEDAIQAATATHVAADYIVTRNAQDFESGE